VGPLDALISTDGDSDRPLLLACTEEGVLRFISGDLLGLAVAEYLEADAIAVPVSASDAIEKHCSDNAVAIERTRIGSPWVIAAMQAQQGRRRVGWEANGGFLTGSTLSTDSGELAPLPTRDAVLPLVVALHGARRVGSRVDTWFERFPRRYSRAGLLDAVDPALSRKLLAELAPPGRSIRRLVFDNGAVRAQGNAGEAIALDTTTEAEIAQRHARVQAHVATPLGIEGTLVEADVLDGLRLYFESGEIIHLRPSGNAPQLRIYAVADSELQAESLVRLALAEPAGVVRQLLARFAC